MENIQNDMNETLITLASDIVAAHVSNNRFQSKIFPCLSPTSTALSPVLVVRRLWLKKKPEPAVSVRASVKPDYIVCLEDGKKLKMLKRHLMTHYNMTPEDYRARWNLPADYPMVAPNYAEKRRELAKKIGLGRKPNARRGRKPKAAAA